MGIQFNAGDVLEVQFDFDFDGIDGKMIQFWRVSPTEVIEDGYTLSRLADNIFDHVKATFKTLIHTQAEFQAVKIRNRTNDLYEGISTQTAEVGTGTGINPPFVAISIFQQRETTATRNGYKRFPFVAESKTSGNAVTVTVGERTFLETLFGSFTLIVDTLAFFEDVNLEGVIIPRVLVTPPDGYEPNYAAPNGIDNAFVNKVTSQNSRKT